MKKLLKRKEEYKIFHDCNSREPTIQKLRIIRNKKSIVVGEICIGCGAYTIWYEGEK